jgi:RNase H-fold protein (predicted Holliday junction resolvase)
MFLGLDISTTKIGVAIIDDHRELLETYAIRLKEGDLCEKAQLLKSDLRKLLDKYKIKKIFVEEPLMVFSRNSMAKTLSILQRFNGMASYVVYEVFGHSPIMVNVNAARKKVGVKIVRGVRFKNTRDKKQPIIDRVVQIFKSSKTPFVYGLTKQGNPEVGTDDRADAIVMALQGIL